MTGEILLITRQQGNGWYIELKPKGGWENDESQQEAAARETYEEAGARGKLSFIGIWDHKQTDSPNTAFIFFEMEVDKLEDQWPEMDVRNRQWDALKALAKPFMREVVERCSLAPSNK
ncbi:5577_t:CDS:2 [Cetraspora pellucida]|uniref:5577_t:CDS:1 n=1 Tax=Cetraspora pellucida TaxID=1433469 RepID=A0A9N8VK34_9GLOM|nr:5577_t:CDS:2 [Cetraspora pellucida]